MTGGTAKIVSRNPPPASHSSSSGVKIPRGDERSLGLLVWEPGIARGFYGNDKPLIVSQAA